MVERYLEMKDGHRLFLRTWNEVDKPVGTLPSARCTSIMEWLNIPCAMTISPAI